MGFGDLPITKFNIDELRSGFEAEFYKGCQALKRKHRFDIEYEPEQFNYYVEHWYKPDWRIARKDDTIFFVETKGYWTSQDRSKIKKVLEQHSDLDLRMVFQYDNKLHKSSNTRYSDWCVKHDIPYAIGVIPEEWFE